VAILHLETQRRSGFFESARDVHWPIRRACEPIIFGLISTEVSRQLPLFNCHLGGSVPSSNHSSD